MNLSVLRIALFLFSLWLVNRCTPEHNAQKEMQPKIDKLLGYWNTGNFDDIENTLHEEFEMRMSPLFEPELGIESFKESVKKTREKYPDFTIKILEAIYGDSAGAGRWTMTATSKSGKKLNVMGISILHFKDGKIKDEWISSGDLLWMQQLGYTLTPPQE